MSKKIALGVASALLGITGVAGASVAVTSSANVDSDEPNASVSFHSDSAPDLSAATDLLGNVPGVADVLTQAEGVQGMADGLVNTVTGQLPVGDLTGLLDAVPSACGALPFSLPVPTHTVSTAMGFFNTIQGLITEQLGLVASLAPSTPTVLSAPEVLDMVKGQVACAGSSGESALPFDVPSICAVDFGGVAGDLPDPARDVVLMAIRDVADMTNQNVAAVTEGVVVACSAANLPVPAATPAAVVPSQTVSPQTILPATPLPAVNVPAVNIPTPVGTVSVPSVDLGAGVIPSITVGPISTPAISLPALPLGGLLSGLSVSGSAHDGGLLGNLLG
jgi:hypothetical protein